MERRKFLIGAGTLGAGASVALGTGAFTTVEAQRNVDIGTAGDANAQLAIQALNGANANELISTEDDETLSLSIPDVNQDAVTEVEDLFRIVNQGTQPVSLFFRDDSDAVTFRVSRETQSLEGADNSIKLGVGSQVVVGLTIDTLNNDVSGTLLDSVTIIADASASAPEQSGPQPQYVVDGIGNSPNTFETLSDVLSNDIDEGAFIGIEGGVTIDESNVTIDTPGVTIAGVGLGTAQINLDKSTLTANRDDITLRNLTITRDDTSGRTVALKGNDATADGLTINKPDIPQGGPTKAGPHIFAGGKDVTITDCDLQGSPISLRGSGSATVTNNSISDTRDEGIFAFTTDGLNRVDITNNVVDSHNTGGGKPSEIKIDESGIAVNDVSSSNPDNQRVALLQDNDVNTVLVKNQQESKILGTKVSSQLSFFSSIQDAVDTAGSKGLTLVESGSFTESVTIEESGLRLIGLNNPVINGEGEDGGGSQPFATIHVDDAGGSVENVTVEGFSVRNPNGKFGIFAGTGSTNGDQDGISGLVIRNNTVENISTTSSGGSLVGGPAGIGIRGDYGTGGNPGIEISNNEISNVQSDGFTNASGITLKSFTGDAGFGFDSNGDNVPDESSPPATDTDILNNNILNIDGGDDSRTKGISVSGEFEDVVVDGNDISSISAAADGSAGDALAITFTENGGSYSSNEFDIDEDGNGERIGPREFEIRNNDIDTLTANSTSAIFIGGYEDLDGDGTHEVSQNTINDGVVARFTGNQDGFQPGDEDALNLVDNTFRRQNTVVYVSDGSAGADLAAVVDDNEFDEDVKVVSDDSENDQIVSEGQ